MKGKKMTLKERMEKIERDKNERRRLFKALCDHVSNGLSIESFSEVTTNTLKSYFKLYPEEFSGEEFDTALQKGREYWEDIGRRQANGNCLGNSRTWYYNMANRFGWREKLEVEAEHKGQIAINVVNYASQKTSRSNES